MADDLTPSDDPTADLASAVEDAFVGVSESEADDGRSDVEKERDEFLNDLKRLQADFENYRKRVARDADDAANRAAGSLVAKILPVLDAFDLAQSHFADSTSDEAQGLSQARGLLLDTLSKEGLERIDAINVAFDPQVHDAVMHEPGEGGEQLVLEVLRAGYRWKGGVLRPAMVKVQG
jgi:molecular chaperone GrpE